MKTRCMGSGSSGGLTGGSTKGNTSMTRSMGMGRFSGLMGGCMKVSGKMGSSTEKEFTPMGLEKGKEFGKRGESLNGCLKRKEFCTKQSNN